MNVQTISINGKPALVVLPIADYELLLAASEDREDAAAMRDFLQKLESGEEETLPESMVDTLLSGANKVKTWREYRKLSLDSLAKKAGISKPFLSQIEGGKRIGSLKTLTAIAKALNVSLDDLKKHR